jgi:hypothetical protein
VAGEVRDHLVDRGDVLRPSTARVEPAHALRGLAFFADGGGDFARFFLDGLFKNNRDLSCLRFIETKPNCHKGSSLKG